MNPQNVWPPLETDGAVLASLLWPSSAARGARFHTVDAGTAADLDLTPVVQALCGNDPRRERFVRDVLTTLCTDPAVISYRADTIQNLAEEPELRQRLGRLLESLAPITREQRGSLFGVEWTVTEILERVSELELYVDAALAVEEALDSPLVRAHGLCALRSSVRALIETDEFQALRAELPALHARLDTVQSVTIGVNLSGGYLPESATILSIDTERIEGRGGLIQRLMGRETSQSGITPLRRAPLGNSGLFFPPMGAANRISENELVRDLQRLLESVAAPVGEAIRQYTATHLRDFAVLEGELALLLNAVAMLENLRRAGLPVCYPERAPIEARVTELEESYSISLALRMLETRKRSAEDGEMRIVTNRVTFNGGEGRVWILTGPNRGGKTTYARTVGLAHLLYQAGLFVPARQARLSPVDAIFTHFPNRESAITGEGRLDEEARRLAEIFQQATPYSLILLNEVLSGTSTLEALVMARDALRGLHIVGARSLYVTHLHELALQVQEINAGTPGDGTVGNLVAEVDESRRDDAQGHGRTFRIRQGMPLGFSYASDIAEQHGISYSQLLSLLERRGLLPHAVEADRRGA